MICSLFGEDREKTAVKRTFSTQLYTKPQRSVDFWGPRWTEAQTRSTAAPDIKDGL